MSKSRVRELEKTQWAYYKTWMSEKTFCKALNKEVRVTRSGWDHITHGTKSKYRNIKDKINRLYLLKFAKAIIKSATAAEVKTLEGNRYYSLTSSVKVNNRKQIIKVVLKEDKNGNLTFYSVMKR